MKWIRYSKYTGDDLGISAEELLKALADFLLESGFNTQYMPFSEWNQHTLEDLKNAIQQALEQGKMFPDERLEQMMEKLQGLSEVEVQQLLDRLLQRLVDDAHITIDEPNTEQAPRAGAGHGPETKVKFKVTDKTLDFLGLKT